MWRGYKVQTGWEKYLRLFIATIWIDSSFQHGTLAYCHQNGSDFNCVKGRNRCRHNERYPIQSERMLLPLRMIVGTHSHMHKHRTCWDLTPLYINFLCFHPPSNLLPRFQSQSSETKKKKTQKQVRFEFPVWPNIGPLVVKSNGSN